MKPGTSAEDLVYVSSPITDDVYVFAYPGGQLVGTLTGLPDRPTDLCSDADGNVWVTNGSLHGSLVEYAHGGTSVIATLDDSNGAPQDCSVDPTTGNLAVGDGTDSIAVYQNAQGTPTYYSTGRLVKFVYYLTYDGSGNIYFAYGRHPGWLPEGGSQVAKLRLRPNPLSHGPFEWDGQYLTVLTANKRTPYEQVTRYRLSGRTGKMVGNVPLKVLSYLGQYWIQGSGLVAVDESTENVYFYHYPSGGNPTQTISGLDDPHGITISVAPSGLHK
jgi:WD40 repeat protein